MKIKLTFSYSRKGDGIQLVNGPWVKVDKIYNDFIIDINGVVDVDKFIGAKYFINNEFQIVEKAEEIL